MRRAGVNEVTSHLQGMGLIDKRRGLIKILDNEGLEGLSCECHGVLSQEYERLLGKKALAWRS